MKKEICMGNFTTSDTKFSDLNGSMTTTGNNINSYTSNNLGSARVSNRPAPPPVSCVLTFSNGTQYTLCGRPSGSGFVGKAQQGNQACPSGSGLQGGADDDWTATAKNPEESLVRVAVKKTAPAKKAVKKAAPAKKAVKKAAPAKKAVKKAAPAKKAVKKAAPSQEGRQEGCSSQEGRQEGCSS